MLQGLTSNKKEIARIKSEFWEFGIWDFFLEQFSVHRKIEQKVESSHISPHVHSQPPPISTSLTTVVHVLQLMNLH